MIASLGGDAEHQHELYIRHINEALEGRPEDMAVTTHMCRGNFRSSWVAEGGYDFVAEALFGELAVDGFFMEWDDDRSGGFEPLRFVPKDKIVVLGLVTTKRGELETKDELKRRIEEASRYVDVDQLCLSPQCGFSSTVEGNAITDGAAVGQAAARRRDGRRGLGRLTARQTVTPWCARSSPPSCLARAAASRSPSAAETIEPFMRMCHWRANPSGSWMPASSARSRDERADVREVADRGLRAPGVGRRRSRASR